MRDQFDNVATHFNKFALRLDDLTAENSRLSKIDTESNSKVQGDLTNLKQQMVDLAEVTEGLAATQTSIKKNADTSTKEARATKLQVRSIQNDLEERGTRMDFQESELASLASRFKSLEDMVISKIKALESKMTKMETSKTRAQGRNIKSPHSPFQIRPRDQACYDD